ncbi:delta-lactam-biosynthetic de-N-acetylase [Bacillus tuaregi]|uniref:delta-lactam-biosynthetic de-N-acetylase n=1 Tax=Bacillus tuaregi TaxID=1816695 RepID=UPI0008F934FA|nr:delta-lactam-biosynthetic de-N-acetylase [Bacillus tuaregi]
MKRLIKQLMMISVLFFVFVSSASAESYPNRPIHWGFKKASEGRQAEAGQEWDELLKKHEAYYKGDPTQMDIYLTFDNGYENGYTAQILDILKKEKVPATFFVTGHYLESASGLVKRMVKEGHIVGNHSWHHPDLSQVSDERFKEELEKVKEKTEELTGVKKMHYLRPPRGIFSERTMALANEEGYTHVFWSLAFKDWLTDQQKGAQYSYDNIMNQIHPGAIILLHTVSKDNADALESVIKDLKKQGYKFKSLDDLTNKNHQEKKQQKKKKKKK